MSKLPRTIARGRSPLELLAIRPESDDEDIILVLTAFGMMFNRQGAPLQVLKYLLKDASSKAIPVSGDESEFAYLASNAMRATNGVDRFQFLREAREWLVAQNRQIELTTRRKAGSKGGRPRARQVHTRKPNKAQAIMTAAVRAVAEVPRICEASPRRLVEATAKRSGGRYYSQLEPRKQKNIRDYVRKVLTAEGWFS